MKRKAEEDEQVFKETMPENIPNLLKAKKLKFQGAEWTPSTLNPKKFTMGHIIIRLLKAKSKGTILKADREMVHYFLGKHQPKWQKISRHQGGQEESTCYFQVL